MPIKPESLRISKCCVRVMEFIHTGDVSGIIRLNKEFKNDFRLHVQEASSGTVDYSEISIHKSFNSLVKSGVLEYMSPGKYTVDRTFFSQDEEKNRQCWQKLFNKHAYHVAN